VSNTKRIDGRVNVNQIKEGGVMKALSKRAEAVFRAAMAECSISGSCKLNLRPGTFMALCVERIGEVNYGGAVLPLWSFAHYGEQNGDLMRDPDVVMMDSGAAGLYPMSFRNDYLGVDNESLVYEDGKASGCRLKMQASITSFCATWAGNLKDQQGL